MISNPYILLDENSWKKFYNLFFQIFIYNFIVYTYFTYAATASTITDDVTKLVMHWVFNTNLTVLCYFFYTHLQKMYII